HHPIQTDGPAGAHSPAHDLSFPRVPAPVKAARSAPPVPSPLASKDEKRATARVGRESGRGGGAPRHRASASAARCLWGERGRGTLPRVQTAPKSYGRVHRIKNP